MMIVDAIDGAPNECAVFFLVTAYLETFQHLHPVYGVPEPAVRLPVRGLADLERRRALLSGAICRIRCPAGELQAVIAAAVHRLTTPAGTVQLRANR